MQHTQVYLGLGGNEGDVLSCLQQALALLARQEQIQDLCTSHFYHTAPFQVESPAWFVNVVCSFSTVLLPQEIFNITQSIENQLGKIAKPKTAARPIDIDLLFYGETYYQDKELEIPHARWMERLFVLIPLKDLIEEIVIQKQAQREHYVLQDLIQPLLHQSPNAIYLLEKNPAL